MDTTGKFEISFGSNSVYFQFKASLQVLEETLEMLPGIGDVYVTTNSAKDPVEGMTVSVTQGIDTIVPSSKTNNFSVGDWVRIGDRLDGDVYSISHINKDFPFSIKLSSDYRGESDSHSLIFEHKATGHRSDFQYIVKFDPSIGDIPAVEIKPVAPEVSKLSATVVSCDKNVNQAITLTSSESSTIYGTFYVIYGNERTKDLSYSIGAEGMKQAIENSISVINSVNVSFEQPNTGGHLQWLITLESYEGSAQQFIVEGHLLSVVSGKIDANVFSICPIASFDKPLYRVETNAGQVGSKFVVDLNGPDVKTTGKVVHTRDGEYLASYITPRVGEYKMSVKLVTSGGLEAHYFNNRWLYGNPIVSRFDSSIDFEWGDNDFITPTGKDFVSIVWTGFVQPSFSERFNFTVIVNDGARLWIDDMLLIDAYESDVDQSPEFFEYCAESPMILDYDKLISIKLEYRENRGRAIIKLYWQSPSQPFEIIPPNRLFSNATDIAESPFTVLSTGTKPNPPKSCYLSIFDWDKLLVSWDEPLDDGGEDITYFQIEHWDNINGTNGVREIKQMKFDPSFQGTFQIGIGLELFYSVVSVNMTSVDLKTILESVPSIGQVKVTRDESNDSVDFTIEYLTNVAPVPKLFIESNLFLPNFVNKYCICEAGLDSCLSGSFQVGCDPSLTRSGTISTSIIIVEAENIFTDENGKYQFIIENLLQNSSIGKGFGVRVSAGNSVGFSSPCPSLVLKPRSTPDPPLYIEAVKVAGSASNIKLYFSSVSFPANRASEVSSFFLEWSTSSSFDSNISHISLSCSSLQSTRGLGYNNVQEIFYEYILEDLVAGSKYYVRIGAVNEMGIGRKSQPILIVPGSSPGYFEDRTGVSLDIVKPSKLISIGEACTSLKVSWQKPSLDNGFEITSYLIEYWTSPGVNEVVEIYLQGGDQFVVGTFTLSYNDEKTDSIDVNSSADQVAEALEQLATVRSVHVERLGMNPHYRWIITFLADYPSVFGYHFKVDALTNLIDSSGHRPLLIVNVKVEGMLPLNYASLDVQVHDTKLMYFSHLIRYLTPGQKYFVQISAQNAMGYGKPQLTTPEKLEPPKQRPSEPLNANLSLHSGKSLLFTFSESASNGGDTITKYKIEWDLSDSFDSKNGSPMGSYTKIPENVLTGCHPCTYIIDGLETGQTIFARVHAYNSYGYSSQAGISVPLSPKTQAAPPSRVAITPKSRSSLLVSFLNTSDNGGQLVSKFKIEWAKMGYHSIRSEMDQFLTSKSILFAKSSIQTITLSSANSLEGSFRVSFNDHRTSPISFKASAMDFQGILQGLPTLSSINVSKYRHDNRHVWVVTFFNLFGTEDWFGDIPTMKVSFGDQGIMSSFSYDTHFIGEYANESNQYLFVEHPVRQFNGYEQQVIQSKCSYDDESIEGYFTIAFEGKRFIKII